MTDIETYRAYIIDILQPYAKQGVMVSADTRLTAELGLSSLQVMEVIEKIEDYFDISVPLNLLPDMNTAQEMAQRLAELASEPVR